MAQSEDESYYAVIFSSTLAEEAEGYEETAARMVALAERQPGYLGHESFRGADGRGITVSYWRSEADIRRWKALPDHRAAQAQGREAWYARYRLRICKVVREYGFEAPIGPNN